MQISGSGSLNSILDGLANKAGASFKNGAPFSVSLPVPDKTGTAAAFPDNERETLSGEFSYMELEPAGDTSLFDPNDPSAPDAGRQAFTSALLDFLSLVHKGGEAGMKGPASYTTSASFSDSGSGQALSYSGSFTLIDGPAPG